MRAHHGITDGNRSTDREIHRTPEPHRFVSRRWIPVDEIDSQIGLGLGEDLDGDGIAAGMCGLTHIELIGAVRSRNLGAVRDLLSVYPDIGAVIDALEVQPDVVSGKLRPQIEFSPIPPGALVGTVI